MQSVAAQTVKPNSANGDIFRAACPLTGCPASPNRSILQENRAFRRTDIGGDAACRLRFGLPNPEVWALRRAVSQRRASRRDQLPFSKDATVCPVSAMSRGRDIQPGRAVR